LGNQVGNDLGKPMRMIAVCCSADSETTSET
jgi:hypothetical protein